MERDPDFSASRKRGATPWILAFLGAGVVCALLVLAATPEQHEGVVTEQVVPNTPPPVRTE